MIKINTEQIKTQWHPAFCSAMRLELRANKKDLEYYNEYNLSRKPLQMDLLVIKKCDAGPVSSDIGRIFLGHNIMEYKSPRDGLNIDDYFKVLGYACLYKAGGVSVDAIRSEDITISFVRDIKPTGLLDELRERGMRINPFADGIYYVENAWFPMQVIVTSELNMEMHWWLGALTERLSDDGSKKLLSEIEKLREKDEREFANAILTVSVAANKKLFHEMKEARAMYEALRFLMTDELQAAKEEGKIEVARRLIQRGRMSYEEIAEDSGLSMQQVEKLAEESASDLQPA